LHGKVINLLSNDFAKFDLALAFLHDLWKGPFETILLGFLIYREVGISGVIGIVFILSFIPIQCEYFLFPLRKKKISCLKHIYVTKISSLIAITNLMCNFCQQLTLEEKQHIFEIRQRNVQIFELD
jgi:hypothetical protein